MNTRVKELREAKGWSKQELAKRSGLGLATIQRLENGNRGTIYLTTLRELSKALGVGVSAIIV